MASSSTNNSNIKLRPRICDYGKTTAMYIVRTNENGNQWRLFFVCPSKYGKSNKEHCNYFKLRTMMMGTLPRQSIPIVDLVKQSEQKN
ncbi:hypothetical protein ACSBR1_032113 [Camellia fascicularis]